LVLIWFIGIGYSILLLNLGTLTYYSVNAAVPLIYAINSLHDVMPWMSCNNTWNSPNCSTHDRYDEEDDVSKYLILIQIILYNIIAIAFIFTGQS